MLSYEALHPIGRFTFAATFGNVLDTTSPVPSAAASNPQGWSGRRRRQIWY